MRSLVIGIVLLGVLTPMALCQTADNPRPQLVSSILPLKAGVTVRVAEGGKRGDWQFVRMARDSVTLSSTFGGRRVALGDIDTLWVRRGGSSRGAIIGAIVGGFVFSGLTLALASSLCESPSGCRDEYPKAVVVGLVVGGWGGAFLGAGIGTFRPQWKRLYP